MSDNEANTWKCPSCGALGTDRDGHSPGCQRPDYPFDKLEAVVCEVKEEDRPAPVHFIGGKPGSTACGDEGGATMEHHQVTCPQCRQLVPQCRIWDAGMDALAAKRDALNPLYIRVGNVEIVGLPGRDALGIPASWRVMVNGKRVRCRKITIEGGMDKCWEVNLHMLPAEEKGSE